MDISELTEIERRCLNYIISTVRKWDSPFEIYRSVPFYLSSQEKIRDQPTVNAYKKRIHDFLTLSEFVDEQGLYSYKMTADKGRKLFILKTIEAYEEEELRSIQTHEKEQQERISKEAREWEIKEETLKQGRKQTNINHNAVIISFFALASSVAVPLYLHYAGEENTNQLKHEVQELRSKLIQTRNEFYRYADSVYQTKQPLDTSGRAYEVAP